MKMINFDMKSAQSDDLFGIFVSDFCDFLCFFVDFTSFCFLFFVFLFFLLLKSKKSVSESWGWGGDNVHGR